MENGSEANSEWHRHAGARSDVYKIIQREIYCMYSCSRDKNEFLFLTDEISQRRKPCTPDIGIDLLLCSDPDIYLLANCKRQDPFSV